MTKSEKRARRHRRIRAKVKGTAAQPRLSVFRSSKGLRAQLIDDDAGKTLLAVSDMSASGGTKTERAKTAGLLFAKEAKTKKISAVVLDRGGFIYAGRIKAFADGAREGGLIF